MRSTDGDLTVEELAARVGVPTSTVRMYQSKGL
ncbi:helix-turn-helix domain-containing protein, partial [Nocardia sp. NPDC019302]